MSLSHVGTNQNAYYHFLDVAFIEDPTLDVQSLYGLMKILDVFHFLIYHIST